MGDANEEELYKRAMMDEKLRVEEQTRQQQEALRKFQEEQARKAAEEAAKGQGKMVADPEQAAPNWPDDGFQAMPGRLDRVKGALGIGAAGDAALAGRLLSEGRPPASDAVTAQADAQVDGAQERQGVAMTTRAAQAFGR